MRIVSSSYRQPSVSNWKVGHFRFLFYAILFSYIFTGALASLKLVDIIKFDLHTYILLLATFTILSLPFLILRFNFPRDVLIYQRRSQLLFFFSIICVLLTVAEIIAFKGFPLLWLLAGDLSRDYKMFGFSGVHGLTNSLIYAISYIGFQLYLINSKRKYLVYSILSLLWFLVSFQRIGFVVLSLSYLFAYLLQAKLGAFYTLAKSIIIGLVFIFLFGTFGDLRSGENHLVDIGIVDSDGFLAYAPSGLGWVYLYITTPMNNLFSIVDQYNSAYNFLLPNTFSGFLPNLIRNLYVDDYLTLINPFLVAGYFTVTTGLSLPYIDAGWAGIAISIFALYLMMLAFQRKLIYAAIGFPFILTLVILHPFENLLFSLPFFFAQVFINLIGERTFYIVKVGS